MDISAVIHPSPDTDDADETSSYTDRNYLFHDDGRRNHCVADVNSIDMPVRTAVPNVGFISARVHGPLRHHGGLSYD